MTTFSARMNTNTETDLARIVDFLNLCESVDQLDEGTSLEELGEEYSSPHFDPTRDTQVWEDADGVLLAYGQLMHTAEGEVLDNTLWFRVHPDQRGIGLEDEVVAWAEKRAREYGREQGKPVALRSFTRDFNQEHQRLFGHHGLEVVRYFWRMRRSLSEPIAEPQFPDGYRLSYVHGEQDIEPWLAAFNGSFIDHFNHHDMTVGERQHRMQASYYAAEDDLVAIAPDGSVAGFCWCEVTSLANARSGRSEGWIALLGTKRGHRQIGLGRALLLAGLHRLKQQGVEWAILGVDGESPTGATRLYESVGFEKILTWIAYSKRL